MCCSEIGDILAKNNDSLHVTTDLVLWMEFCKFPTKHRLKQVLQLDLVQLVEDFGLEKLQLLQLTIIEC